MTQRRVSLTFCVSPVCPSPGVVLGNAVARALGGPAPSPLHFTHLHIDPASTFPPSIAAANVSSQVSARILHDVQDLLEVNRRIVGFCTDPGGVFSWEWKGEPPGIHSRSYQIADTLLPAVHREVVKLARDGRISQVHSEGIHMVQAMHPLVVVRKPPRMVRFLSGYARITGRSMVM